MPMSQRDGVMKQSQFLTCLALAFCMVSIDAARGETVITWDAAPTNIAGDSDVSTSGTLVAAYNIGDPSVLATTINGVTFAAFPIANGINSTANGSLKVEGFSGTNPMTSTSLLGSANTPFSNLSSNYRAMLSTGVEENSNTIHILDVRLLGLTVGNPYTL